ncbi:MAG: heavy metal translocating P-type ATPase [Pirellulales bacterium]|nr:heavy metal translocating P-type ATPase [Pirellulales bacterium]
MPIDPICGMNVEASTPLRARREGDVFYFCSEHCRERFLGENDAGSGLSGEIASLKTAEGNVYTCPMHPEIRQDAPGDCPKCGMELEPIVEQNADNQADYESRWMVRRFWVGFALGLPVVAIAMSATVGVPVERWIGPAVSRWIQFALATPVVLWAGWPFFARGWRSVASWNLNMFTLIAMGTGAAYFYSAAAMLFPDFFPESFRVSGQVAIYFEAATTITVLVLLGQVLELRARRRTAGAIRELMSLAPPTARVTRDGHEVELPLDQVRQGDLLRVRPGDKVPVDGEVTEGGGTVDESMMTGESAPVAKGPGETVLGGTVNRRGAFLMRAERVGRDTVLARIIDLVAEAQRSRAPIQRVADAVAGYFVPAVVLVAVATFLAWAWLGPEPRLVYAIVNAVAVLIVACPCTLGLATPMSIMVGVGRGAREGVLIRSAEVLELMRKVDTIVVDKTGTLTEGRPRLTAVVARDELTEDDVLRLAASVEQNSEHPMAHAILEGAKERCLGVSRASNFDSATGRGVSGTVDGRRIAIGSRDYLVDLGITGLDVLESVAARLRRDGNTVMFVGVGGKTAGLLAVADPIKKSTPAAIKRLREWGLNVHMLTGDNRETAMAVAESLEIDHVEAQLNPREKHERIKSLRAMGRVVAMAGDGINDAPALAEADVGIAMGTGTDVAMESAGVTLVKGDLQGIVKAFELSRAVMRNVHQNLFFALVYNGLGIPIAAGVLVPVFGLSALLNPMIAAAAMSFSSVSVIGNALRLRGTRLG